jgi:hypothetical protein
MPPNPSLLIEGRNVLGRLGGLTLVWLTCSISASGAEAKLNEVTLSWRGEILHPIRTTSPWLPEYPIGSQILVVSNATILGLNRSNYTLRWIARSPDGRLLDWLAASEGVAYVRSFQEDGRGGKKKEIPKINRLDLRTGKWLTDLSIPGASTNDVVVAVEAQANRIVLLSASTTVDENSRDKISSFRVNSFAEPAGKMSWTKAFVPFVEQGPPGAYLWSARRPISAVARIRHISFLGDDVLICAGPRQPLVRLKGTTGEAQWTI